jgi:glycosyltransferase involved in cell wall biosynthesis
LPNFSNAKEIELKTLDIYIPFHEYHTVGGPSTFMQNLEIYLKSNDFIIGASLHDSQAVFFPIQFDIAELKKFKSPGRKIIQRLDGVYYPQKHGHEYSLLNTNIRDIYINYTDFVVFQSEYCKRQCFTMFGEKNSKEYEVILNGVDKTKFYTGTHDCLTKGEVRFITTGNFRNIDMIEPIIFALDELKNVFSFRLTIIGPIVNQKIFSYLTREYIHYVGSLNLNEVSELLRESDIFLYSHLNPPCPNSVIEAVSTGLPVVSFDSGAMSELLYFAPDLLAYVSDDLFQNYEDFCPERLKDKIIYAVKNFSEVKERALAHSYLYAFEECGRQYTNIFQRFSNSTMKINNRLKIFTFGNKIKKKLLSIFKKLPTHRFSALVIH